MPSVTNFSTLPRPSGLYSLRFYKTFSGTGNFSDNEYQFFKPGAAAEPMGSALSGASPTLLTYTTVIKPVAPGSATVSWQGYLTVTGESPTVAPPADGSTLTFAITTANNPLTLDPITLHWTEATVAKSAILSNNGSVITGTNAANVATASIAYSTGIIHITFAATHAPDTGSITIDYKYVNSSVSTVTDNGAGQFSASGVVGSINYETGQISIVFTGATHVPYNGDIPTIAYNGPQGWSKGIRVVSASGGFAEFSFDGINVHGRVDNGEIAEYWDRYEPGIAVRGSGTIKVEAW